MVWVKHFNLTSLLARRIPALCLLPTAASPGTLALEICDFVGKERNTLNFALCSEWSRV